jgi:tripartite-type tricarboxylate transporter receptor subunit TctC
VQRRLQALGVRAQASTPQELGRLLSSEIQRWRGVIVAAKIPQQ